MRTRARGGEWALVGVLTATMALAITPRVSIGVLAPFLVDDFGSSRAAIGLLVAVATGVAAVLSPLAGTIMDRVRDRTGLLLVIATGIVGLAAMAAAATYAAMAAALALGAFCRGASNPATNRVIASRFTRGNRGWVTGIKQSGEAIASIVAAVVLPATALAIGWHGALAVLAALACLAFVAAARTVGGDRRARAGAAPRAHGRARVRRSIRWLTAYSFAMGAGGGCITAYLPLYAHEKIALSVAAAGAVMAVAGAVAVVCRILFSRVTETRLNAPTALLGLAAVATLASVLLVVAPAAPAAAVWLGAALWGASGMAFGSVCMLAVMAESDDASTGRASGLVVFGFGIGSTLTPPVFGWLVDHSGSYVPGLLLVSGSYAVAALIMAAGGSRFRSIR